MNKTVISLLVIGGIIVVLFLWVRGFNNSMVDKDQAVQKLWSDVESQYQRRFDMYGNIVSVIKGSANFEKSTLEAVIEARNTASKITVDPSKLTPESIQQFQQAQDNLKNQINIVFERYPDLKTTAQYQDFQTNIVGTENRINKARDDFNAGVQDYNSYIKRFPNNLFAGMFGYSEKGYFKAATGTEKAPEVKF